MIKLSSSQFISIGVTVIISIIICSSGAAATDYQNATQISEGEYSDSIIGVDHDIYEINLESGDTIDVQLNYSDSASNPVDFTIRDSEADRVSTDVQQDTPTTDTVTKQAATQVESAGTYYIHVDEDQGRYTTHESTTDYTLSVDKNANDPNEPNGEYADATEITPGTHTGGELMWRENDIYEINLESGDTIDVQLNYSDSASNPVDFTIRDSETARVSTDVQQDTPTTDTVTKQAATQVESAGTYYIHVDEDQGRYTTHESTTDYTLSVDLSQDDGENEESEETTDDSEDTADDGAVADTGEEEVAEDGAVDDMGEEEEENIDGSEEQDSDGDGVPDSEDYAPRDPEIQDEGDTRQPPEQETTGDGGAVESADSSPGLGIVSSLAGLGGASYLLKRRMDKQDSE